MQKTKDPAAVSLGRRGGRARVPKGFATMDPERRREIASRGGLEKAAVMRRKKIEKSS